MGEAAGLNGRTVYLRDHERLLACALPYPEQFLSLSQAPRFQFLDCRLRQRHVAAPARLRLLVPDPRFRLFGTLHHGYGASCEVDIAPTEREDLAPAQAAQHG